MRRALLGRAAAVQHCGRRLRQTPAREARDDLGSFDGATRELSWGELQDLANAAAHTLAARGVGRGDRVAEVLPPTPETAAVFFGVRKLCAILLSISVLYGDDAIAHRLSDSEACLLVTDAANAMRFDRDAFVLDEQTLADAPTDFVCADTSADDPAQLYYTSGTTGLQCVYRRRARRGSAGISRAFVAFHVYAHLALFGAIADQRVEELEECYGPRSPGLTSTRAALERAHYLGSAIREMCWEQLGPAGKGFRRLAGAVSWSIGAGSVWGAKIRCAPREISDLQAGH